MDLYLLIVSGQDLHLYFAGDESSGVEGQESEFVITEELKDCDDWFLPLAGLDIDQKNPLSYDVLWPKIVLSSRNDLQTCVQTYDILEKKINGEKPQKIVTHDLEKKYRNVVDDIGRKYNILVEHQHNSQFYERLSSYFIIRPVIILLLIDELYAMLRQTILRDSPGLEGGNLFFPYPGRFESMSPIIRNVDSKANILVPSFNLSWTIRGHSYEWESCAVSVSEYASLDTIKEQIILLMKLQLNIVLSTLGISLSIDQKLRSKYDVTAPKTVDFICRKTVIKDIRAILSGYLIQNAISEITPKNVVVGGMNPRDRRALLTAEEIGANTHYIPHSIAYENEIIPPTKDTIHYVAGPADRRVINDRYPAKMLPEINPAGRPYLDTLVEQNDSRVVDDSRVAEDNIPRIIIATQPYEDWIRNKFVRDNLTALDKIGYSGEVVIKIHPSERREYYTDLIKEVESTFELSVRDANMSNYISGSEIVVTINSNVGLESILLNSYCISYNPFEPFTWPSSYIDGENVPYETTREGYIKRMNKTLNGSMKSQAQLEYLHQAYNIGNSVEIISQSIDRDASTSSTNLSVKDSKIDCCSNEP